MSHPLPTHSSSAWIHDTAGAERLDAVSLKSRRFFQADGSIDFERAMDAGREARATAMLEMFGSLARFLRTRLSRARSGAVDPAMLSRSSANAQRI